MNNDQNEDLSNFNGINNANDVSSINNINSAKDIGSTHTTDITKGTNDLSSISNFESPNNSINESYPFLKNNSIQPVANPILRTPAPSTPQKKKHVGLIVSIIIAIIAVFGGGAFIAFAITKNQPENIAAESINNLINANQVTVSGAIDYISKTDEASSFSITIDSRVSDTNNSSNVHLVVNTPIFNDSIELDLGEIALKDGTFYFRVNGITKVYSDNLSYLVDERLRSYLESSISAHRYENCYDIEDYTDYRKCMELMEQTPIDPATQQSIDNMVTEIETTIASIIERVDNQWLEFSIQDVLNSDLISRNLDLINRAKIEGTYKCFIDKKNRLPEYSNELSNIYSKNSFLRLEPAADSSYKVSFDAYSLTNYLNDVPSTRIFTDLLSCVGVPTSQVATIQVDTVRQSLSTFPEIYAKFDGFLEHHLTSLKIVSEKPSDYFTINANFNFAYPTTKSNIAAPTDSKPIMHFIQEAYSELENLSQSVYTYF